jgi:cytochrome b6
MKKIEFAFILRRLATILAVSILTLSLTAAVTGILLAFYYEPAAGGAYGSLRKVTTEVDNGWLIQSFHAIAGNGIIVISLLQIIVMFLGRSFAPSWLTAWISGILLTLTAIALSWTAIILDWTQIGYWRFRIELGTLEAIPWIGPQLRTLVTGGETIGTVTLQHLYALHSYIFSIAAILLSVIHLIGLLIQEQEEDPIDALPTSSDASPPEGLASGAERLQS